MYCFHSIAESGLQGDLRSPGGAPLDRPIRVPLAAESCCVLLNYAPALPGEHVGMPQGDLETPGDERSTDDDPAVQPEHLGHELEVKWPPPRGSAPDRPTEAALDRLGPCCPGGLGVARPSPALDS